MATREFIKMHGLGNDFVVIDARNRPLGVGAAGARALANRHTGVGFDQLIIVEPASDRRAAAFMRIRNADGGEVSACGNATRCVARLLFEDGAENEIVLTTWAAADQNARPGDTIRVAYFEPETAHGDAVQQFAEFTVKAITPLTEPASPYDFDLDAVYDKLPT